MPVPTAPARTVFRFTIPKKLAADIGHTSIGMVRLTGQEEIQATERAAGNSTALAYHLTIAALREVDGQPVSLGEGTSDEAFGLGDPRFRSLAMQAHAKIHNVEESDARDFLASCEASVG